MHDRKSSGRPSHEEAPQNAPQRRDPGFLDSIAQSIRSWLNGQGDAGSTASKQPKRSRNGADSSAERDSGVRRMEAAIDSRVLAADTVETIMRQMPWLTLTRYADPKCISAPASAVYSQNFEDAVLSEIFHRIGDGNRRFVEIGAGRGHENTTRFFLEILGWSGLWVEADPIACALAREQFAPYCASGQLRIIDALVTAENINDTVGELGAVDLLSIDVDQNTSHVWRALNLRARVACIEYNAFMPRHVDWEVPYEPGRVWDHSKKFGASLKRLETIGRDKGMALVGCDFSGVNAFFVADDEDLSKFQAPFTAEFHYEPFRRGFINQMNKKGSK